MHLVAQLVPQGVEDDLERAAVVVGCQVLHVLKQERGGALRGDDACHIEEQGALRLVSESGRAAKAALLGDAGQAERLAGEAGEHDVAVGDVVGVRLRDVARHVLREAVVRTVRAGGELVPLGREHRMPARGGEATADAADAGEQVDGTEVRAVLARGAVVQLAQRRDVGLPALHLA